MHANILIKYLINFSLPPLVIWGSNFDLKIFVASIFTRLNAFSSAKLVNYFYCIKQGKNTKKNNT